MSAVDQLRRLWQHAAWADAELLAALRAAPAVPATILREYAHVLGAEELWLARVERRTPRAAVWPTLTLAEAADLSAAVRFTYYNVKTCTIKSDRERSPPSKTLPRRSEKMSKCERLFSVALAIVACSVPNDVIAQDTVPPVRQSASKDFLLADGTEISVKSVGELSGKTATTGDVFTWRIAKPVVVNNYVLIAEGAPVKGSVTEAKRAGMLGKSGKLGIRLESTKTTDGQTVKLRTTSGKSGDTRTGATVGLVILFGPLGLLKHGTEGILKDGTVLQAFVDEDVKVVPKP